MEHEESGWKMVRRKRGESGEQRKKEGPMTFFFRNFPEDCTEGQLWRRFEEVGKVEDVCIPAKRDKSGKRFGFVRFARREESRGILERLNKVWVGSYVIRAFIPRFVRPSEKARGWKAKEVRSNRVSTVGDGGGVAGMSGVGRASFVDMLKGGTGDVKNANHNKRRDKEAGKGWEFTSLEEEGGWLVGALTGRLKDDFLWKFHGEEIQNECFGKLLVTNMGDRMVLLRSETNKSTEEVIEGLGEWAAYWLEWWRPWKSRDVNLKRLVWTRWIGTPLQAWSRRFFS